MSTLEPGDKITVLWAGERREVTVVKPFKNGKVRVQIGRARWTGGRPGSLTDAPRVTVEPWQIVHEPVVSHGDHTPMAYDEPNSDLAHLCQICGQPMDKESNS